MKTRAEAVAFLRSAGFEASERDWALGETISVAADPEPSGPGEIVVYRRVIYIVPRGENWTVMAMIATSLTPREIPAETLDEACRITVRELSAPSGQNA
jgi:hypothetical protein